MSKIKIKDRVEYIHKKSLTGFVEEIKELDYIFGDKIILCKVRFNQGYTEWINIIYLDKIQ